MLLKFFEFYEKYDYLFAVIFSIIMWAIGFFSKHFIKQIKKSRTRKVLCLNRNDVEILIPDRHGKLTLTSTGGATELTDDFITKGEMEAALKLKDEINGLGLRATILNHASKEQANVVFCIGGPLSNLNTAKYFRNKSVFLPLTFGVHKDSQYLSERNRGNLADLVHEDDGYDENGDLIGTLRVSGKEVYRFNRKHGGYVFLAKLTGQTDFRNGEKEIIHICFGNNSITTLGSVKSYFKYNELNKFLKKQKHYCVVIGCDDEGNLNYHDIHDFTNVMLVQKTENHRTA